MARPVRTPMEEVGGVDEEFQLHLDRGAELLTRGDADAARESLARAADLKPGDPKTLGLLGQALYRLGKFDEAAALFGKLVEQNPLEAGAQVNLGLAKLRARRYVEAISHLERALDLNPEHRKAMGYLGLAWLEHGNVARAREWFSRAGSEHMVARCDELLAAARRSAPAPADPQWTVAPAAQAVARAAETPPPVARETPPPAPAAEAPEPAAAAPAAATTRAVPPDDEAELASAMRVLGQHPATAETPQEPDDEKRLDAPASAWDESSGTKSAAGWRIAPITLLNAPARCTDPGPYAPVPSLRVATTREPPPAAPSGLSGGSDLPPQAEPSPAEAEPTFDVVETAPVSLPDAGPAAEPRRNRPVTLEELVTTRFPAEDADADTFFVDRHVLRVAVRGEVLTRVAGIVAARGELDMSPETRRYRGRGTDKLFGDGRNALHRVRGSGALLLRTGEARHTVVDLAGSAGFFREDGVFAMEASIEFDNARLTARAGPDVDLVQLRGQGSFVLVTHGDVVAVDVSEMPLRVAVSALIGWTGALTPRLTTLAEAGSSGDRRAVELTGEGRVLLDSGVTDG